MSDERTCKVCEKALPLSEYYFRVTTPTYGTRPVVYYRRDCKTCYKAVFRKPTRKFE